MRKDWIAVGGITLLALAVRLLGLDAKGFWEDEAATVLLLKKNLGGMLAGVADQERAPYLYYLLAWPWTRLFGDGEVGLRSLSVLFGTATVPVAYLAARELISRRAGIVVAALIAVNPILVWYSQEGRAYALLVLLSAVALYFFARALHDPRPRWLGLWALSSALAISTHYFAAFLFIAEAGWLLASERRRPAVLVASGIPALVGLAYVPLAITQSNIEASGGDWISNISIVQRVAETPGFFMVGFEVPFPLAIVLAVLAAALVAGGLALLLLRGTPRERRGALVAGTVGLGGLLIPLVLTPLGLDFFIYKNVLATLLPLAIVIGAGYAAVRAGRTGIGLAVTLVALSFGIVVASADVPKYQKETWRQAVDGLGPSHGARAIVITPGDHAREALEVYLPQGHQLGDGNAAVEEIDVLALPRRPLGGIENPKVPNPEQPLPPPPPGFRLAETRRNDDYLLLRYLASAPSRISGDQIATLNADPGAPPLVLVEQSPQ